VAAAGRGERAALTSPLHGKAVVTLTTVPDASQITANADFQNVSGTQGSSTAAIDGALVVAETGSGTGPTTSPTVGDAALTTPRTSGTSAV
jgi:hypothetical protein